MYFSPETIPVPRLDRFARHQPTLLHQDPQNPQVLGHVPQLFVYVPRVPKSFIAAIRTISCPLRVKTSRNVQGPLLKNGRFLLARQGRVFCDWTSERKPAVTGCYLRQENIWPRSRTTLGSQEEKVIVSFKMMTLFVMFYS